MISTGNSFKFILFCSFPRTALTIDRVIVIMADEVTRTRRPKLVLFDLDYTLWPFWIDTHVSPPMKKKSDGFVYDGSGKKIKCFKEVPDVLEKLKNEGYLLGVASRTEWPEAARQLLKLFDWEKYFQYLEIYPGRKTNHFKRFKDTAGIEFKDMLFFDDEERNIRDVSSLGVTCIFVPNGVTHQLLKEGLDQFAKNNS